VDTATFGTYTLTLVVSGSGITDLAGNALTATTNPSTSWVTDDTAPENNTLRTAKELGILSGPLTLDNLGLITANAWYRFTLPAKGGPNDFVSISFQNSQGDLDLELYGVAGQRLKGSSTTLDGESISLNGLAAGTYYIRVYGKNGATNPS